MRKILLILAFSALTVAASAQADSCYATLEKDTLRLGNSLIERAFVWNNGALETVSLTDKTTGYIFRTDVLRPDFSLGRAAASDAVF